jgi:rhodanese-related sulfurtransferase
MPVTKGFRQLVAEAEARIQTRSIAEAQTLLGDASMVFVDLRDPRELEREGMIPGAFHATRGMLEFWVDPESPYYKPVFGDLDKHFVLYCGGGWRSALAATTMIDMGLTNVSHIDGGFAAWKQAGAPTVERPSKPPKES